MPAAARVGDLARKPSDSHGNDCCPHDVIGAAVQGSPNVFIEGRAALRVGDPGVHSRCCGPNTWLCAEGVPMCLSTASRQFGFMTSRAIVVVTARWSLEAAMFSSMIRS